jgi:hypothetical protein
MKGKEVKKKLCYCQLSIRYVDLYRAALPEGTYYKHLSVEGFNPVHHVGKADPLPFLFHIESFTVVFYSNMECIMSCFHGNIYLSRACMLDDIVNLLLNDAIYI